MIYLDSCALVKLVIAEPESVALKTFLSAHPMAALVTSTLSRTELLRTVRRHPLSSDEQLPSRAFALLEEVDQVELTRPVLDYAGAIGEPHLRSLDAIHLAAALALESPLAAFVTYDHRLARAAKMIDLKVASPV